MCKACTVPIELPDMLYTSGPQKCCLQCKQGAAASRFMPKLPKKDRSNKRPTATSEAKDAVGKFAGKLFGKKK